jgi:CBS domain-containing protein
MFMNNDFSEQPKIGAVGVLPMRRPAEYQELRSKDPALHVMTDFTSKIAIAVAPDRQIDAALTDMVRLSVRAMLVLRDDSIIGLITSYDIEGPRPLRFAERSGVSRREDIRVGDIMTEWDDLPTLDWHTVQTARISDILEIFEGVGVMHLLVVESDERGAEVVRGLISRSRIERHLHAEQFPPPIAGEANEPQWKVIVAPAAAVNPPQ